VTEEANQPTILTRIMKVFEFFKQLLAPVLALYHPDNLKKQGPVQSFGLILLTVLVLMFLMGLWWSREPSLFDVQAAAQKQAEYYNDKIVPGYVTTSTLIEMVSLLRNKTGGYLSNDIMPPSIFMDDMSNWEWGVLQQVRDLSKALRNDMSRSRTQGEDPDLAKAEPKFNTDNNSWFWPASEDQYQEGMVLLERYRHRLAAPRNNSAQFLVGTRNLRDWLEDVAKRLGSLSQRLSASVGQMRMDMNVDSSVEDDQDSIPQINEVEDKTPWMLIDDVFYETRGTCYALIHFMRAIEVDFNSLLEKKNALLILQDVIRELEATQKTVWSPMILNGSEFGLFANHSLVLSSYISRANTGIIELYNILERN